MLHGVQNQLDAKRKYAEKVSFKVQIENNKK